MTRELTCCSNAWCYKKADPTGDPEKPPFCRGCQERNPQATSGPRTKVIRLESLRTAEDGDDEGVL